MRVLLLTGFLLLASVVRGESDLDGFVGSDVCGECHQQEHESWRGSDHAKAMAVASPESVLGDFTAAFESQGRTNKFSRKGQNYYVETTTLKGVESFQIKFTFGHYPLQQYLVETQQGRIQALNVAWDSRPLSIEDGTGQRWFDLQALQDVSLASPLHWQRHLMNWNARCADCHSTNIQKNYDPISDNYETSWSEINVACEACHGPAGDHIKSNELAKANPMAIREKMELCGGCHVRGAEDKIPASGGFIKHHEQFNESLRGPHNEGNDVTCITCHDQHKSAKFKEGIKVSCESCHEDVGKTFAETTHGGFGVDCIECHMPRASKSATKMGKFEGDVRTHIFRINTEAGAKMFTDDGKFVAGDSVTLDFVCLHCHQNKDLKWATAKAKNMHGTAKK